MIQEKKYSIIIKNIINKIHVINKCENKNINKEQ